MVSYRSIVFALGGALLLGACAAGKSASERQAEDAARSLAEDSETCAKVRNGRPTLSDQDCMRFALNYRQIGVQPGPTMLESPSRAFTNDLGACGKLMASTPGLTDRDCIERMLANRRAARAEQQRQVAARADTAGAFFRADALQNVRNPQQPVDLRPGR